MENKDFFIRGDIEQPPRLSIKRLKSVGNCVQVSLAVQKESIPMKSFVD